MLNAIINGLITAFSIAMLLLFGYIIFAIILLALNFLGVIS